MKNTYTFNPDNINIKGSFTWENTSTSKDFGKWTLVSSGPPFTWENTSTSKDFGKWTLVSSGPPIACEPPPTDEEMIERILPHMEDKGMLTDIVEWLRKDAPKKLRGVLNGLDKHRVLPPVPYEYLCRVVYELGFRANEVVEGRMILGSNNEWVRKYFEDFPPTGPSRSL